MAFTPNRPSSPDLATGVPKEYFPVPPTPPPAYYPRLAGLSMMNPVSHGWHNVDDDEIDDDDDDGNRSAITVRISTAVQVTGDNNVVHMAVDPAATARLVAEAVTRVIGGGRGAQDRGGIPMIDEEGRPRPLRIEIEAGTAVHGKGNLLGSGQAVLRTLGKRRRQMGAGEEEGEEQALRVRRRRSASV